MLLSVEEGRLAYLHTAIPLHLVFCRYASPRRPRQQLAGTSLATRKEQAPSSVRCCCRRYRHNRFRLQRRPMSLSSLFALASTAPLGRPADRPVTRCPEFWLLRCYLHLTTTTAAAPTWYRQVAGVSN